MEGRGNKGAVMRVVDVSVAQFSVTRSYFCTSLYCTVVGRGAVGDLLGGPLG
jgi:hypothetical protein